MVFIGICVQILLVALCTKIQAQPNLITKCLRLSESLGQVSPEKIIFIDAS